MCFKQFKQNKIFEYKHTEREIKREKKGEKYNYQKQMTFNNSFVEINNNRKTTLLL